MDSAGWLRDTIAWIVENHGAIRCIVWRNPTRVHALVLLVMMHFLGCGLVQILDGAHVDLCVVGARLRDHCDWLVVHVLADRLGSLDFDIWRHVLIFYLHLLVLLVLLLPDGWRGPQMHTALRIGITRTLVSVDHITVVLHIRVASIVQAPRVLLSVRTTSHVKTGAWVDALLVLHGHPIEHLLLEQWILLERGHTFLCWISQRTLSALAQVWIDRYLTVCCAIILVQELALILLQHIIKQVRVVKVHKTVRLQTRVHRAVNTLLAARHVNLVLLW